MRPSLPYAWPHSQVPIYWFMVWEWDYIASPIFTFICIHNNIFCFCVLLWTHTKGKNRGGLGTRLRKGLETRLPMKIHNSYQRHTMLRSPSPFSRRYSQQGFIQDFKSGEGEQWLAEDGFLGVSGAAQETYIVIFAMKFIILVSEVGSGHKTKESYKYHLVVKTTPNTCITPLVVILMARIHVFVRFTAILCNEFLLLLGRQANSE